MAIQLPKVEDLPKFAAPPVIETVLSVQFSPLTSYSNAHAGWFWKNYLGSEWTTIQEVPRLDDQFERFEKELQWRAKGGFRISTSPNAERHQVISEDQERMIQFQDSRFIYNWRKRKHGYPSYEVLAGKFFEYFTKFRKFATDAGNNDLSLNQWEVVYVNHLLRGREWDSPADWPELLPWLKHPAVGVMNQTAEGVEGSWSLAIAENYGRLHVKCTHIRIGSTNGPEALALQLTARGPISAEMGIDINTGFNIGHSSIVLSFGAMTSLRAQKELWESNRVRP